MPNDNKFDAVKTHMTHLEEENKQLKLAAENTAMEITDLKTTTVYAYSGLTTIIKSLTLSKKT